MARGILLVMDSVGIGGARDAAAFGDEGADTLGHIAAACAVGAADQPGVRSGALEIPVMNRLGIARAAEASTGLHPAGIERVERPDAIWAVASEVSKGKDTQSGHWELAGLPVPFVWGYFPDTIPAFPPELTDALIAQARLPGILGNRHASGTGIIEELGEEHIRTGKPICYTSADSVFQICAHEKHFGLERLYEVCRIARKLCDPLRVGRVIARPFVGETRATFKRTGNRKDLAVPPPGETLLDLACSYGRSVFGVGKISDIFSGRGVSKALKAPDNESQFLATLQALDEAKDGDLVVTNFIDFDQLYGHRRDVAGYAACLEDFDRRLPELIAMLRPGDLVILTADHGNDPTFRGVDHTRENIPVMAFGPKIEGRNAGHLRTYADVAQTLAAHLALPPMRVGASFM
jgi:phosphopentomutase